MERYFKRKNLALAALLLLGLLPIALGRVPELPSSGPAGVLSPVMDVRLYLRHNHFAISFSVITLFVGGVILCCGGHWGRTVHTYHRRWRQAGLLLGAFIFLSGVWVLTDSSVLDIFVATANSRRIVHLLSFLSFMLLPLLFLSFLRVMEFSVRGLRVFDALLMLNFACFVLLTLLPVPRGVYFFSLLAHHALIFVLMLILGVRHARDFFCPQSKQRQCLARGVLLFMACSAAALVCFLFVSRQVYAAVYGVGFVFLIWYMIRILGYIILAAYQEIVTLDMYKELSCTDVLTGLKNRNAFIQAQQELQVDGRTCLVVADLNGLKQINDSLGHRQGDEAIRRAAQAVQQAFSGLGECYRIGGDEFAVLCQGTDEPTVQRAIAALRQSYGQEHSLGPGGHCLACGYAFGGGGRTTPEALFDAADAMMYADKGGR